VTLFGRNFGVDPLQVSILWCGAAVVGLKIPEPHTTMTFTTPAGPGGNVTIDVRVGGQAVTDGSAMAARFVPPTLLSMGLAVDNARFDCSSGEQFSSGLVNAVLVLYGSNFGTGVATEVLIDGVPCAVNKSISSHNEVYFETAFCRGRVEVVVGGVRSPQQLIYKFSELVALPYVGVWGPFTGPTSGGTVVTLTGLNFQYRGVVEFVRGGDVAGECVWDGIEGMMYNSTFIRYDSYDDIILLYCIMICLASDDH
jgi:hypothetical protein